MSTIEAGAPCQVSQVWLIHHCHSTRRWRRWLRGSARGTGSRQRFQLVAFSQQLISISPNPPNALYCVHRYFLGTQAEAAAHIHLSRWGVDWLIGCRPTNPPSIRVGVNSSPTLIAFEQTLWSGDLPRCCTVSGMRLCSKFVNSCLLVAASRERLVHVVTSLRSSLSPTLLVDFHLPLNSSTFWRRTQIPPWSVERWRQTWAILLGWWKGTCF